MASVAIVEAAMRFDGKALTKGFNQAKAEAQKLAGDGKALGAAFAAGLGAASIALGSLVSGLKDSGDFADDVRNNLRAAFGDTKELDSLTKKILDLGATPPFTEQQFSTLAKRLRASSKEVEANLTIVGNLAVKTGAPFEALGEAYAQFGRNPRATKQIEKLLGITPDSLVKYGAVLDQVTGQLDLTGANAQKAVDALAKFGDDKAAGAMDASIDAVDVLAGELTRLKQELGIGISDAFESLSAKALPVVKAFRELSDETKSLAGLGVLAGSIALGLGAIGIAGALAASSIAANVVALGGLAAIGTTVSGILATASGTVLPLVTGAFGALALAVTPLTLTFGAILVAVKLYTDAVKDAAVESEKLFQIEEKRAGAARTAEQFIGKSAAELAKAGKTAKDVAAVADGLADRAEQAYNNGNTALLERLKTQVGELREVQRELARMEADQRDTKAIQEGVQAALGPGPADDEKAADDAARQERQQADDKARDEASAKEKEAHQKRLKAKQDALNAGAKIVVKVDYEQAKGAEDLTNKLKVEQDKRLKDLSDAAAAGLATAKQNAQDLADAQSKGDSLQGAAIDRKVSGLQDDTEENGTDNSGKIKAAFNERLALNLKAIQMEAEKAKANTQSADARIQIEKNARLEIEGEYAAISDALDRSLKEQSDSIKKFKEEQNGESTLGSVLSLDQYFQTQGLGYGQGRKRPQAPSASSLPSLQSVLQPLPNANSGDASSISGLAGIVGNLASSLSKVSAKEQAVKVDVSVSDDRVKVRTTTGVNGRMGDLEKAGRGQKTATGAR